MDKMIIKRSELKTKYFFAYYFGDYGESDYCLTKEEAIERRKECFGDVYEDYEFDEYLPIREALYARKLGLEEDVPVCSKKNVVIVED